MIQNDIIFYNIIILTIIHHVSL